MNIITKSEIIKALPIRYKNQYPQDFTLSNGKLTKEVKSKLENAINLTESEANEIIGNDTWTRNTCLECNQDKEILIEFGENDYDKPYYKICKDCLNEAIEKIK